MLRDEWRAAHGRARVPPKVKRLKIFINLLCYSLLSSSLLRYSLVRVIVPGHVGVRNVKWLESAAVAFEEAHGTYPNM